MKKSTTPRKSKVAYESTPQNATPQNADYYYNLNNARTSSASIPRRSTMFMESMKLRNEMRVFDNKMDVTPKPIDSEGSMDNFIKLQNTTIDFIQSLPERSEEAAMLHRRTSLGGALRVSIDDVVNGIAQGLLILYEKSTRSAKDSKDEQGLRDEDVTISPFIKICLRQTEMILLFEQRSTTVAVGTDDAKAIEKENKAYDYVTKGKGRLRRKADSEAQTTNILYKSRDANTNTIEVHHVGSYVSNFDMFDTYQKLEQVRSSIELEDSSKVEVTTLKIDGIDPSEYIGKQPEFELAQMVTQRVLAGNVFKEQQRRFRNMFMPDPLSLDVQFLYRVQVLWVLDLPSDLKERHAVSCMSWCPNNGDILAVGYGIFTCAPHFSPKQGYVRIWTIKNPVNSERIIEYNTCVVSVEFSQFRPQLLAIGLYDGTVEIRDITSDCNCTVAVSQRETSPGYSPVTDIKWIALTPGETDTEPFLTVSQDASIMKYRAINSPHLVGYQHAILDRVEGSPEGLPVRRQWDSLEAVRNPQCLGITLDPTTPDIFYVISNEGVLYKCSTNYPQQHLSLWQVHEGAVYSMEFSPWSPNLFVTCGDDWCIRIWINGIFKPLITLTSALTPVNCVCWSKTHSTVIVAITRRSVDIWDIRRSTLKPMSSTRLQRSNLTLTKFSNCGRSLAVGNEKGSVFMCAMEDMPFPAHFQYQELEAAIFKALMPFPDLVAELKAIGYFGYPKQKGFVS